MPCVVAEFFVGCDLMQDRILKIGSWNARGLGTPAKRAAVFDMLEVHEVGLICLQETHYTNEETSSE